MNLPGAIWTRLEHRLITLYKIISYIANAIYEFFKNLCRDYFIDSENNTD